MAYIFVNKRKIFVPDCCPTGYLRKAAGIQKGRNIGRKTKEGTHLISPGDDLRMEDGDEFIDMPPRIKA